MAASNPKYIKIDDWFFEIKTVRALKVNEYGEPYKAIANCSVNGNSLYVDGLMTRSDESFNKRDLLTFYKFCKKLGMQKCHFDRFNDGQLISKEVKIKDDQSLPEIVNLERKTGTE